MDSHIEDHAENSSASAEPTAQDNSSSLSVPGAQYALKLSMALFDCLDIYICENNHSRRVSPYAFRLLYELRTAHGYTMSMFTLSERLSMQRQQVSVLINNLEPLGLVVRNREMRDSRALFVNLTPSGILYVDSCAQRFYEIFDSASTNQALQNLQALYLLQDRLDPALTSHARRKPVFRPIR